MTPTTDTSLDAFKDIKDAGDDDILRRRVAAAISNEPMTIQEISASFPDNSLNAVRPRVTELVRMGLVNRNGKRKNKSGKEAYIHHLTADGRRYLAGAIDPNPDDFPTITSLERDVVDAARKVAFEDAHMNVLEHRLDRLDRFKQRVDPEGSA